ncbi:hypothetical protein B0A81_08550 [Flavobacterium plurextorum]|uniref:Lipoprotein SmpA/OmlA domain-containing protein n=1 Tax=Flavobacterium plurextorum TaxID=1114867 RepID=A0ABX4CVE1_9FLAO|nr:hypothetical protein [Flavobacterium plurextorum]OXB08754.1 hypothetical protein B0A81_08550 [Flavobacterium plurextorum]
MKKITLLLIIVILTSCSSSKNTLDGLTGKTRHNLIKSWGFPIRTINNAQGQILVYADQVYKNSNNAKQRIAGPSYWNYTYIYIDFEGKVYSYKNEKQNYPPQQIVIAD